MNWLDQAPFQPALWAGLVAAAAVAGWLRIRRPAERRSLHFAFGLLALAAITLGIGAWLSDQPVVSTAVAGAGVVLAGLAVIQVATVSVFRGLLPMLGLAVPRIAQDLTNAGLSLLWLLLCLRFAGLNPAQLFTTSAIVTAVIAFSMQDTLGNVLGGIVIQLDNSLRVGDWVRLDDVNGRVEDVRWRYTTIRTRNGELVMVPNSWLMKNRFYVLREPGDGAPLAVRRAVVFQVDSQAEPSKVIQALERSVLDATIANVLAEPPPSAVLTEVASGFNRFTLRYWLSDPQHDDPTDSAVRIHALAALGRADVPLGVPREEHLMIKENEVWHAAAQQREAARRLEAIRQTDLFAALSPTEQSALAERLIHAPFAAGDIMTRQGAVAHWLYLIVRGEARVLVDGPQGKVEVATLGGGSVFGEMGLLTGEPRSATVVAATAVDCYRLDKQGFAEVLRQRPDIAREISSTVEARAAERAARLAKAGAQAQPTGDLLRRILNFFSLGG